MVEVYNVKIISGNRITLPEAVLKDLGVKIGNQLVLAKYNGQWILITEDRISISVNYIL